MHGLKGVVAQLNESTLTKEVQSDVVNALIIISIKGLKYGTPEALDLIKQASISFGQHRKTIQKSTCSTRKRNFHANIGLGNSN